MMPTAIARSHSSRFGSAVAIALLLLIDAAAAAPETLTVDGRKLLMDGKPWVMRGVTYAPTPVGNDPGWGRGSTADYHSTDYSDIHARDIDLLEEVAVAEWYALAAGLKDGAGKKVREAAAPFVKWLTGKDSPVNPSEQLQEAVSEMDLFGSDSSDQEGPCAMELEG